MTAPDVATDVQAGQSADVDRTARAVRGDEPVRSPEFALRQGVVTAINVSTARLDVTLGGDTVVIPGVAHTANARPQVGDTVWVAVNGPDLLVLDRVATYGLARHSWTRFGFSITEDNPRTVPGMTAGGGNGGLATYNSGAGSLTLNKPGLWTIKFSAYSDVSTQGMNKLALDWSGGAFTGSDYLADARSRFVAATPGSGQLWAVLTWTGYANATQAAAPIATFVHQINAGGTSIAYNFELGADYLGG